MRRLFVPRLADWGRRHMAYDTRRRIVVRKTDTLVVNGYEVDASVLGDMMDPERRLLWAFVRAENGVDIRPVPYDETRVVWLAEEDLRRREAPNEV